LWLSHAQARIPDDLPIRIVSDLIAPRVRRVLPIAPPVASNSPLHPRAKTR
jgi:hypothetical protein